MVTKVGLQADFANALKDLLEREYDAIEGYRAALANLQNLPYRQTLAGFLADHERHTRELATLLTLHGEMAPTGPSAKQWLTKGKVILTNLFGDKAILYAMVTNEADTLRAYKRLFNHEAVWQDARSILQRGLEDENHQKAWLERAERAL